MQGHADMLQRIAGLTLTDVINLLFRSLQDFRGGTHLLLDHFGNICRGITQCAKHRLFLDDTGIAHCISRSGGDFHQLKDIVPGIVVEHAQLPHFIQYCDRVHGFGEIEHGINRFKNLPVLLQIEVLGTDFFNYIRQATAVDQN